MLARETSRTVVQKLRIMDGLVTCLKGKNEEERKKTIESLDVEEATAVKAELAKMKEVLVEITDLKSDPTKEMAKSMEQVMKEVSSMRHATLAN